MAVPRLIYLNLLLCCSIFYIAYAEWFSWILLLAVALFPWLSLVLSIPAIRSFRATPAGGERLLMDSRAELWLIGSCSLPMPPFRGILRLQNSFTGELCRYNADKGIPTAHCGSYSVRIEKAKVYDYLGLFAFPVRRKEEKRIYILPKPVEVTGISSLQRQLAHRWRPKPGGGFSENHELRLYRPGDRLNQVHWKLSAKTGKLILREPMEPQRGLVLLTMTLRGTPEELDRKLGRMIWLGNHILRQEIPFELRVLTGAGIECFSIANAQELSRTTDVLLASPTAADGSIRERSYSASWHYHIGGRPDEAR